jgi:hypothetical protein
MRRYKKKHVASLATLSAVLSTVIAGGLPVRAQTNSDGKLEQENQELRKRLDAVEDLLKKEGIKPSGAAAADPPVSALSDVTISGFVSASYFYDVANNKDAHPAGYLWNTSLNSFTLNKLKLTMASPPVDKDKLDAAYRASFIWGQDAPIVDTGSTRVPGFSWVREAYVEMNIPIGTGLDIKAGELISLLNYESGDGGAANGNFSQGYQWYYTGNPPAGAIQLGYAFNDMFGLKLRLQNGLYNGPVETGPKTFVGDFSVHPDKKTSLDFLGFSGEQDFAPVYYYLSGGEFIGSRQLMATYNLTLAAEADYFHFSGFSPGGPGAANGDFWSIGGWLSAAFTDKLGATLRADYIADPTGFGTIINSPAPGADAAFPGSIYTSGSGQRLNSVTLTLDYTPVTRIKIQPEVRWNHSTYQAALNGKKDQVIIGMGASYLF